MWSNSESVLYYVYLQLDSGALQALLRWLVITVLLEVELWLIFANCWNRIKYCILL